MRIKHLLDNLDSSGKSSVSDKVLGMKYILAVSALGPAASASASGTP